MSDDLNSRACTIPRPFALDSHSENICDIYPFVFSFTVCYSDMDSLVPNLYYEIVTCGCGCLPML